MASAPSQGAPVEHHQEAPLSPSAFSSFNFDYLVVGGGTAALVIAARLSAIPDITVGVLEAGPKCLDDPSLTTPGRFGEALGGRLDWKFETVQQPRLNGRTLAWPRGRVLGGTSALNFMTWTRGNREDYDAWAELGNEGWSWDEMLRRLVFSSEIARPHLNIDGPVSSSPRLLLPKIDAWELRPFFKKTETLHESDASHQQQHQSHFDPGYHGTDGPVSTVYSKEFSTPHQHWHATLNKLGLDTNKSHFSGNNLGAFTTLTSVDPKSRTRASSATSYYLSNASRGNLQVLTDAIVEKIDLEIRDEEWVATGVSFVHGTERFTAKCESEVILCAGSVQSPQLLEISGIGDPDVLGAAGISVKVGNRNVGENLQEHMMTAMIYELDPTLTGPDQLRADPVLAAASEKAYHTSQSGIYAMLPCALSYASLPQVVSEPSLKRIIDGLPVPKTRRDEVLQKQFEQARRGQVEFLFDLGNWSPSYPSQKDKVYGTMLMMHQLPLTRGSIHIRTSSIHDPPAIDPRYFEGAGGDADFAVMAECQKFADRICRTAPLSSIIQRRVDPPEREAEKAGGEEEDFGSWITSSCITDWHPIGTCAMSPANAGGVVDARLRVHGVKGLRVADASIMPLHICSHPQATVYAIGEKAAAMILEDRQRET